MSFYHFYPLRVGGWLGQILNGLIHYFLFFFEPFPYVHSVSENNEIYLLELNTKMILRGIKHQIYKIIRDFQRSSKFVYIQKMFCLQYLRTRT